MNTEISSFFLSQIWSAPFLLVYLIGIILAVVRWHRHPNVSLFALIAFSIFLLNLLAGMGLQFWQIGARERGLSALDIGRVFGIVGIVRSFFSTVGWVMVIMAIFGWRGLPQRSTQKPDANL